MALLWLLVLLFEVERVLTELVLDVRNIMQHFLVHLLYILFNLFDEFLLFLKLHFEALAIFEVFLDLFEFAFLHR